MWEATSASLFKISLPFLGIVHLKVEMFFLILYNPGCMGPPKLYNPIANMHYHNLNKMKTLISENLQV